MPSQDGASRRGGRDGRSARLEEVQQKARAWAGNSEVRRWLDVQWDRYMALCWDWCQRYREGTADRQSHPGTLNWRGMAELPPADRLAVAAQVVIGVHDAGAIDPIVPPVTKEQWGKHELGNVDWVVRTEGMMRELAMPLRGCRVGSDGSLDPQKLRPEFAGQCLELVQREYRTQREPSGPGLPSGEVPKPDGGADLWRRALISARDRFVAYADANLGCRLRIRIGEGGRMDPLEAHGVMFVGPKVQDPSQSFWTFGVAPGGRRVEWNVQFSRAPRLPDGLSIFDLFRAAGRTCRTRAGGRDLVQLGDLRDDDYWLILLFRLAWREVPGSPLVAHLELCVPGGLESISPAEADRLPVGLRSELELDPFTASAAAIDILLAECDSAMSSYREATSPVEMLGSMKSTGAESIAARSAAADESTPDADSRGGTSWGMERARAAATRHLKHNPFPGVRALARVIGNCPLSTLHAAIVDDPWLAARHAEYKAAATTGSVRAGPLGDTTENVADPTAAPELSPEFRADELLHRLVAEAPAASREGAKRALASHGDQLRAMFSEAIRRDDPESIHLAQLAAQDLLFSGGVHEQPRARNTE